MDQENALSLLSHCKTCPGKCCKESAVFATHNEYATAIRDGAQDHFTKIDLDEGTFYALDFRTKPCPYLIKNACSIYKNRPNTCQIYPLQIDNRTTILHHIPDTDNCPGALFLSDEFRENAKELGRKYARTFTPHVTRKMFVALDAMKK